MKYFKIIIENFITKIKLKIKQGLLYFYFIKKKHFNRQFLEFLNLIKITPSKNKLLRLGNKTGDGGYLVPECIQYSEVLISIGCDKKISFEEDYLKLNKKSKVYLFEKDQSKIIKNRKKKSIRIINKSVGSFNHKKNVSLNDYLNQIKKKKISFQIDCEGSEYSIIANLDQKYLKNTLVIVIEFHFYNLLLSTEGLQIINKTLNKILLTHKIIHSHPNNSLYFYPILGYLVPPILEVTFINKKNFIFSKNAKNKIPHELDRDNQKSNLTMILPPIFYK